MIGHDIVLLYNGHRHKGPQAHPMVKVMAQFLTNASPNNLVLLEAR